MQIPNGVVPAFESIVMSVRRKGAHELYKIQKKETRKREKKNKNKKRKHTKATAKRAYTIYLSNIYFVVKFYLLVCRQFGFYGISGSKAIHITIKHYQAYACIRGHKQSGKYTGTA